MTGSVGRSAYIIISVDGIIQAWTTKYNPVSTKSPLPPLGIFPALIDISPIGDIVILSPFPSTVMEGEVIKPTPKIRVLDSVSDPLPGVQCYLLLSHKGVIRYPLGYVRSGDGPSKQLEFAQAGIYGANSNNPFFSGKMSELYETDENGEIEFPHVK